MCGRFTLTTPTEQVAAQFEVPDPPLLTPGYNVAPSQVIAVVGLKPDGRKRGIALLRWGLVPHWAETPDSGPRPINVRAESVMFKFGEQLREKRCLIPASGFYEWATVGGKKGPDVKLPTAGQVPTGSYEGEGFVILRHPDTAVVQDALHRLISLVRVELG